ncbi:MAG: sensor histidine kinase [Candidatus Binatia bacterium]
MRKRLYLQIYLALVMALGLFALASALVWWISPRDREAELFLDGMAELVGEALPGADRPAGEQKAALEKLATKFRADLTLLDDGGRVVTNVGPLLATSSFPERGSGLVHARGHGMLAVLALPDGRRLLADESGRRLHRPFGALLMIAAFAGLLALAALPVARRLTRRLETLRRGVDELGSGDLGARVVVEGRDEIADLARSFNRAAERIERLVHAQKDALATASHELRSPLARMRVAVELLGPDTRADVRERIAADIDELDDLIGEILLTSRLDASPAVERRDEVDLLALLAEEGARVGADVGGSAVVVRGDARLLRRMARNLFENARRYGRGSAIEAEVSTAADGDALLCVSDRGPGIPAAARERVFEAFYRRAGTSEGEGGSVGLGLALVRRIAASHGGSARAIEREGGGTTLEVRLAR